MTSKERVKRAFEHKCPDRVPIGELAIHSPTASKVLGRDAYTGEGGKVKRISRSMMSEGQRKEFLDKYARDTIDIYCQLDIDMIPVELNVSEYSSVEYRDITESGWVEYDTKRDIWTKWKVEKELDVAFEMESSFSVDGIETVRSYVEKLESEKEYIDDSIFYVLEKVLDEIGKEKFILAKIPNLFPVGTSWFMTFMELIYDDPELTKRLLLQFQLRAEAVAERFCQMDGVDALLNGGDWAFNDGPFLSPQCVEELLVPQVKAVTKICHEHGRFFVKHTDGNIMPIVDLFLTGMGIDCFQSVQRRAGMDLAFLREKYGDKVTLMGNVDCGLVLQFGTEEEIMEDTKRSIEEGGRDGGFILSSDNSIYSAIPPENYLTMLKAAKKYGNYTRK